MAQRFEYKGHIINVSIADHIYDPSFVAVFDGYDGGDPDALIGFGDTITEAMEDLLEIYCDD